MPTRYTFKGNNNLLLAADVAGSADQPCVILLHGGGQTRHSWGNAVTVLSHNGFRVINFDARGHGESDWCEHRGYDLQQRSLDLQNIINAVNVPCALVGASMGGMTALHAASVLAPQKVPAITLVDITLRPAINGIARIKRFMSNYLDGFATIEEAAQAVAQYTHSPRRSTNRSLAKNLRLHDDCRFYWHWDPALVSISSEAESETLTNALSQAKHLDSLPALLMRSLKSDVVTSDNMNQLNQYLPKIEHYNVDRAGHMIAGDDNDSFNSGLIEFLKHHTNNTRTTFDVRANH